MTTCILWVGNKRFKMKILAVRLKCHPPSLRKRRFVHPRADSAHGVARRRTRGDPPARVLSLIHI